MELTQSASEPEELELVRRTAQRLFADRSHGDSSLAAFAELGFLGLLAPTEIGGAGWYPAEAALVLEEAGWAADASPIIGAILGLALLARATSSDAATRWLEGALSGVEPVLFARGSVQMTKPLDGMPRIDGVVGPVIGAAEAAAVIIEISGPGHNVYAVDLDQSGVRSHDTTSVLDTTRAATSFRLANATGERLDLSSHGPAVSCLTDAAAVLACSDSLGTFRLARIRLTEYLTHRIAFGAPIASFQAVQHRLVDLYALERRMEAALGAAVRELSELEATGARSVAIAVAYVGSHCRDALDECMQLSGGLGFTWDYPLHHEMRRVGLNSVLFETPREARTRLARIDGW
jgi:alkylation response protein AidB-like acyl-CoA dehydrogenase